MNSGQQKGFSMKAIALLIVLIALAVGTYLNTKDNTSAEVRDTVETNLAAPVRESTVPVKNRPDIGIPTNTNFPL